MVFRPHFAGNVHLGPNNMAVHVHTTRHYHQSASIDSLVWQLSGSGTIHHAGIANPKVHHHAIAAVGGVVNSTVFYSDQGHIPGPIARIA